MPSDLFESQNVGNGHAFKDPRQQLRGKHPTDIRQCTESLSGKMVAGDQEAVSHGYQVPAGATKAQALKRW